MPDRTTLILYDENGNRVGERPLLDLDTMTDDELIQILLVLGAEADRRGLLSDGIYLADVSEPERRTSRDREDRIPPSGSLTSDRAPT